MKEKLQEYALIAEIIGAIAVVISLLFVGMQVRQSNNLASADSLREGGEMWLRAYDSFQTEESTAFMRKALNDYQGLSKDEKGRFFNLMFKYVGAFDILHNQYEAGLLREETYVSIAGAYYSLVSLPGVRDLFEETTRYVPPYLLEPSDDLRQVRTKILGDHADIFTTWPFLK